MASLREIKDHIASVRTTLKITSAMKLVASAKLHRAQMAVEGVRPYQKNLQSILSQAMSGKSAAGTVPAADGAQGRVAVVALASNSSLCGAFNANILRRVNEVVSEVGARNVAMYAIGRKIAEPTRKAGLASAADYSGMVAHPSYEQASALAQELIDAYEAGVFSRVILVYNHFVSTGKQEVICETYLPFVPETAGAEELSAQETYIMEPGSEQIVRNLLPQVMRLKIYAITLDSVAAEHAARTVAMQTATDNAQQMLEELTLEYNKGRQAKITAEILDLVGGSQQ